VIKLVELTNVPKIYWKQSALCKYSQGRASRSLILEGLPFPQEVILKSGIVSYLKSKTAL